MQTSLFARNQGDIDRKAFAVQSLSILSSTLLCPNQAWAGIDVSQLKNLPREGDTTGSYQRIQQLQQMPRDPNSIPFTTLDSGVKYREVRAGKDGSRAVRRGSNIGAELTIRCKSLGNAVYFSTKEDTDFNELAWEVGAGDLPFALEEGIMGMKLNAARRIEVPSRLVFAARNAGQLPEPKTDVGKQRLDEALKSDDATLVFDVFVTGINQGDNRI
ncbi:hypothetical protein CTEN210_11512 [Chaetoceros tenuissimus]|uniref:peptidylprolyl isomerase n=1 Tax=Chaetoceros tenuissimus TaxID=426638 RepID=A0AAD3H9C6_9STRA|nr:hypothetical protein CTEN210_11512 [Chaetoceros tenuissimus]